MSTSDRPPPTLPTGQIPAGDILPPRCVHNAHPDMCPFCKADAELEANPELQVSKNRPHDFGCALYVNEDWDDFEHANYDRVYGAGSGRTTCTCKKET